MPSTEDEQINELFAEYYRLVHAMQSGVSGEMDANLNNAHTPKHLRTGVNSAMVQNSALVNLLIEKGIITNLEWATALRDGMRAEVERYEKRLTEHYGVMVTLA